MSYRDFIRSKHVKAQAVGFDVASSDVSPALYDWQREKELIQTAAMCLRCLENLP